MRRRNGLIHIMGTILLLSACASPREAVKTEPLAARPVLDAASDARPVEQLVVYAERIRWLAPAALDAERAAAERDLRRDATAPNRLKLALLLSLRRAPFRDDNRARALFSEAANEGGADKQPIRSFAMLLLQELDERWAADRALDEERRQRQALQKKLDQLKAIEEEMDRRVLPPSVTPPR